MKKLCKNQDMIICTVGAIPYHEGEIQSERKC